MKPFSTEKAGLFLALEASGIKELVETSAASSLRETRNKFLLYLRDAGKSKDLSAIVAIERAIVQGSIVQWGMSLSEGCESNGV
jgi:hypothetical protein